MLAAPGSTIPLGNTHVVITRWEENGLPTHDLTTVIYLLIWWV